MKKRISSNLVVAFLMTGTLLFSVPGFTADAAPAGGTDDQLISALKNGTVIFDARYRYEHVDDRAFAKNSDASTLRTRLGYQTGQLYGFSGLLELSNTVVVGDGAAFNNTFNSQINRPAVADPGGTAVNRAFLQYSGFRDSAITVGRQTLMLDNERFVSNDNFRQKQQTFDQAFFKTQIIPHVTANYAYQWQVNGVTSTRSAGEFRTSNHIINVATDYIPHVKIVGYGYLLDFDTVAANSTNTYGVHFEGSYPLNQQWGLIYQGDYAHETDAQNNPANFGYNYFLVEPGVRYQAFTLKGGIQQFGGNGTTSFQTPIGDAHPYSGWADVFAATPANGLRETYAEAAYVYTPEAKSFLDSVKVEGQYHSFEAERNSTGFGNEFDAGVYATFAKHYTTSFEYAHFSADAGSGFKDVDKAWVTLGIKF